jgi:hypothetical protein
MRIPWKANHLLPAILENCAASVKHQPPPDDVPCAARLGVREDRLLAAGGNRSALWHFETSG